MVVRVYVTQPEIIRIFFHLCVFLSSPLSLLSWVFFFSVFLLWILHSKMHKICEMQHRQHSIEWISSTSSSFFSFFLESRKIRLLYVFRSSLYTPSILQSMFSFHTWFFVHSLLFILCSFDGLWVVVVVVDFFFLRCFFIWSCLCESKRRLVKMKQCFDREKKKSELTHTRKSNAQNFLFYFQCSFFLSVSSPRVWVPFFIAFFSLVFSRWTGKHSS